MQLPTSIGDTIGMLINRDEVQRDAYTITFEPNDCGVDCIKFQSIPTHVDDGSSAADKCKESIRVVGFIGYDLDATTCNTDRPELGARLTAINSASIEYGDWTLATVKDAIASRGSDGESISLTFRNDLLSDDDIEHLNSILMKRRHFEDDDGALAAQDGGTPAQEDSPSDDVHPLDGEDITKSHDDTVPQSILSPSVPVPSTTPITKSKCDHSSPDSPRPSPDVFEFLYSQQVLSIRGGRVVGVGDGDNCEGNDDFSSLRSSILSSDSDAEICSRSDNPEEAQDQNVSENSVVDTAASTKVTTPSRPSMSDVFAAAVPSARQSPALLKRAQSLGWRNRFSQAELYPVEITPAVCAGSSRSSPEPISYCVRQVQRGEADGTYGTGATVWPASMVLLKYLEKAAALKNPDFLNGKTVIDLGAGTGITSITAALLGAKLVVCTDGNDHVVSLAHSNVEMVCNDAKESFPSETGPSTSATMIGQCEIRVRKFWWGKDDESMIDELASSSPSEDCRQFYDVILVSDCVLPKLYPIEPLVVAIANLSGPHTVTVLSYEHRYYPEFDPKDKFRILCQENGLTVRVVPIEDQDAKYSADDIEIWEVKKVPPP
mmetsp:Transcript_1442/g.2689  ORF Transcript_1442/g.2689 Transcript_1442/m.2689 type:complete len:605 (+) Transcript_1442:55-1869(+)